MPFNDSSPLVSTLVIGLVLGGLVLHQMMPGSRVGHVMWWVGIGLVVLFLAWMLLGAVLDARERRGVRAALLGLAAMGEADAAEEAARLVRIVEAGYVDGAVLDSIERLPEAAARAGPQRIPVLTLGLRHGRAGSEPWSRLIVAAAPELRATDLGEDDAKRLESWLTIDAAIQRRREEEAS